MENLLLFTDGSVNTKSKMGFGAYLAVLASEIPEDVSMLKVKLKQFQNTSSTKLELQTLLWALKSIDTQSKTITVYTDSQNIAGLPLRRSRLEKNQYKSNRGVLLNNYELYQEFYSIMDQIKFEIIKVSGHLKSSQKDDIDRLFTLVDKTSRNELRKLNSSQ